MTIETAVQSAIAKALKSQVAPVAAARGIADLACIVTSMTGQILGYVGGLDYAASEEDGALAKRQVGSLAKALTYIAGLEGGLSSTDRVSGEPLENIHNVGGRYPAALTVTEAFAESVNTAAVRIARGREQAITEVARRLGLDATLPRDARNLALGGWEASLRDMVAMYTAIMNGGWRVTPRSIRRLDGNGMGPLLAQAAPPVRALRPEIAYKMMILMRAVVESGTGRAANVGSDVIGKTGTNGNPEVRDAWFIGGTAEFVCGIWLGAESPQSLRNVYGGGLPAMAAGEVFNQLRCVARRR